MIPALFLAGCLILGLAFRFYGRFVEKRLEVSDTRPPPAHTLQDGVDYVPTRTAVLFGHHFSSIAGAGPIVGPVIAAMAFGWLPAVVWILVGSILIGGVHDFTCLIASVRNGGRSIGDLCRPMLTPVTRKVFLVFILLTMVYVIIVFVDLTASSFAPRIEPGVPPQAAAEQLRDGGIVATASLLFIAWAVGFGWTNRILKVGLLRSSLIFVPLVFLSIWIASKIPLTADQIPAVWGEPRNTWILILLIYCMLASVLPVWILLQPRDYLSSFLLYACLAGGAIGLVVSGFLGRIPVAAPAFTGWHHAQLGLIFPALFITIACGAVSGFHAMVASGTSAKQLDRESSARTIGYGGMLVEAVLALLAVSTVMALKSRTSGNPVAVFAAGLGEFLQALGVRPELSIAFGLLAVSTFLLTTLDTCTRLSRFLLQELLGWDNSLAHRILGTLLVLAVPAWVVFQQIPDPTGVRIPAWKAIWPAFGATNQLLAALALTAVYAWLRDRGRKAWFVALPAVFMCGTTLTAMVQLSVRNLSGAGSRFIGITCLGLGLMAVLLLTRFLIHMARSGKDSARGTV
jgi:carbon starvation protein